MEINFEDIDRELAEAEDFHHVEEINAHLDEQTMSKIDKRDANIEKLADLEVTDSEYLQNLESLDTILGRSPKLVASVKS
jgi:hypothetical protein